MVDHEPDPRHAGSALLAWARLLVVVAARGVAAVTVGLALWAASPALLGWHVTTVVSDSMQPAIAAGDVIAARPVPPKDLRIGQVLLVADPDHPDRLRLHRMDASEADGAIVTRGDANPQPDSSTVAADDVLGVGALRVPMIGQPIVWVQQQRWAPLLLTATLLLSVVALSVMPAVRTQHEGEPTDPPVDDERAGPTEQDRGGAEDARSRRHRATVAALVAASLVAALVGAGSVAHASFASATDRHASLATAVATAPAEVRCSSNADGTVSISWRHDGPAIGFTTLVGGRAVVSSPADARGSVVAVDRLFAWSRQSVTVRSDLGGSWSATSEPVAITVFSFFGLGFVRCA